MPSITSETKAILKKNHVLVITLGVGFVSVVPPNSALLKSLFWTVNGPDEIGPFDFDITLNIKPNSNGGMICYFKNSSLKLPTAHYDPQTGFLFNENGDAATPIRGFSSAVQIPEVIFDQSDGGQYLFTQYDGVYGSFLSSLSIATGTPLALVKTSLQTQTDVSNLKDTAGVSIAAGGIICAWWITETRFLFCGKKNSNNTHFVWICDFNGGSWKVGSNAATFDNGNAVLALGLYAGGQASDSLVLHSRNVAMNLDKSKIVIAEYNVNSNRTPGGTNDAVRIYQSANQGETWTALLTNNTAVNTQVRHWHFAKFDPFNSAWPWYFGSGDDPLSALVRWNGTAAAPPANTPLTQAGFTGYPGWEVMHDAAGIECRSGDMAIHPQTAYYMCDNSEVNTLVKYAFQISKTQPLQRQQVQEYNRSVGRSPLICLEMPNGGSFWGSIREAQDLGAFPETFKGYDFWYSADGNIFTKIAKTRDNSTSATGTLSNILLDNNGFIIISGLNSRGCKLLPLASTNGEGSLIVTSISWLGTINQLQSNA